MINVGVVGYGFAGRGFHSYLIQQATDLNLYGVVSSRQEGRQQAEQEYGVRTYETLDRMLADSSVELVVIATPHDTHARLSIQSMNAGRHVVTDKIMCLNTSECDAMIESASANGVMLSVFHNRRWDWDYLTVRKVIRVGLIGEPFLFESTVLGFGKRRTRWRDNAETSGGLLYDWGAHLVDHALQLVNAPVESVWCNVQMNRTSDASSGDHARLILRFANQVIYHIEVSKAARINKPRWWIIGTKGSMIKEGIDPQESAMLAGNIDGAHEDQSHRARIRTEVGDSSVEMTIDSVRGSWKSFYQNISDHLLRGEPLAVTLPEMRRLMQVFDAARASATCGESIGTCI